MSRVSQVVRIDPDPITIIATCVSSVAAVLQLVQIAIEMRKLHPKKSERGKVFLPQVEDQSRILLEGIRKIQRAIDNGSEDPEGEFYDAKFRIGVSLKLDAQHFQSLNMAIAQFHSSNLSHTINSMIQNDPAFSAEIGEAIDKRNPRAQERVNAAIVDGKNRDLLLEAKVALQALVDEIEARDRKGN